MGSGNKGLKTSFNARVMGAGLSVILGVSLFCGFFPVEAGAWLTRAKELIFGNVSWVYVLLVTFFVLFLLFLAVSKFGNLRLGPDNSRPQYSFWSWIAMLFAAGMGIGLMYFGVAETMQHYVHPALSNTMNPAKQAQLYSFFHWGIHAWAIYATMGLLLAYFAYRYKLPLSVRSALFPIIRERIYGPIGNIVDIFALCTTFFGITTTLGFGVMQLNAGLVHLGLVSSMGMGVQIPIVIVVIAIAVTSALSGMDKGVKRLSELNLTLGVLLMLFILLLGPTVYELSSFSEGIGNYISNFVSLTFNTFAFEPEGKEWFSAWTILYWAWWIAWAPFVGVFIAKISRGRTIREFVLAVLFVPSLFNFLWMTVFGESAVWIDQHVANGALSKIVDNADILLFEFFNYFPMSTVLSGLALLMIAVFFVTSADSGIMVLNGIASRRNARVPKWQSVFWGVLLIVASLSLLRSGGLDSLQTMTLISALPFSIIMLVLCFGLIKALRVDLIFHLTPLTYGSVAWNGGNWKERLRRVTHFTYKKNVREFFESTVEPAFAQLQQGLEENGIASEIQRGKQGELSIELRIQYRGMRDFLYGIRAQKQSVSDYFQDESNSPDLDDGLTPYIPITYFNDGRDGNDVQYMDVEEIIVDAIREYERYVGIAMDEENRLLIRDISRTAARAKGKKRK